MSYQIWEPQFEPPAPEGQPGPAGRVVAGTVGDLAQAEISPDGATITAVVLTGRMTSTNKVFDLVPPHLSVISVSRSSGQPLRVLYQRNLGHTANINQGPDFLQLSQDGAGQHWLLSGGLSCAGQCTAGFNGWLRDGGLVPLPPVTGQELNEAW